MGRQVLNDPAGENRRAVRRLLACFGAIPGAIVFVALVAIGLVGGQLLGGLVGGVVIGLAVGAAVAVWAGRSADATALRLSAAVPADAQTHARVFNLVQGLGLSHGLPEPDLHVAPGPGRNAMVIGHDAGRSALVLTEGVLTDLSRVELEGLLALLLARTRRLDMAPGTIAAVTLGAGLTRGSLGARLVGDVGGPAAEVETDRAAVAMTRYPPGLVGALEKLQEGPPTVGADRRVRHLWLVDPDPEASPPVPHADLGLRIAALREL